MTEIYKSLNKINPEIMWDIFKVKHAPYNFGNKMLTNLPSAKSTTYGTNSLVFKGSLIWNSLPNSVKDSPTLQGRNKGKIIGGAKELFFLFYYKNLHFWYRNCSDMLIIGGPRPP